MEFNVINTMHIARIDLNLLVVFDTIYAEASITRASRRLNLSQPAISMRSVACARWSKILCSRGMVAS